MSEKEPTITEYKEQVIELFKNGKASPECYEEMASAVFYTSENDPEETHAIDTALGYDFLSEATDD